MKKGAILVAFVLLLCVVLASCGMDDTQNRTSTTTTTTTTRDTGTTTTTERRMDDVIRDNGETVSEMFSEGFSEMRDSSFLDPQNGIISDTQPN